MKRFFLLTCAVALAFPACKKENTTDDTPKTRTVYFATIQLETGRDARVMLDITGNQLVSMLITQEVGRELKMNRQYPEQSSIVPFYDVVLYGGYGGELYLFIDGLRYSDWGKQADFSRQERITGQHIDIVICNDGFRRMFNRDLSKLPIDLHMVVPYDWGMSEE